ncbi:TetR/AcrR family transcriptional regulator [Winogradskya consettensis]|uniref:TetR family transcriptional regulator n=1 Tax=Winogradskya consettensis TaxID=113560 RepID=A0A919STA9_9ACTN|nr:TetR/AcrR family transcriptional regulator [Actinoplanes consettensis]GIM77166.1 TetR family transcriptional regulator [Actinoplanes consettensis]
MDDSSDPRATRSRQAILSAARELLLDQGPAGVTHQRVAQQAGVGRATVYRHWPQAEQLLLDVMDLAGLPFFAEPRVPLRAWFRRRLRELADELAMPEVAAVALTLMQGAVWDEQIARQRDQFVRTLTERIAAGLALATRSGETGGETGGEGGSTTGSGTGSTPDPHDAAAMLVGPILYRTALQGGSVPDAFIDRLVDQVLP